MPLAIGGATGATGPSGADGTNGTNGATGATGSGLYTGAVAPDGVGPELIQPIPMGLPIGDSNLFADLQKELGDSQMMNRDLGPYPVDFSPPGDERIEMAEPVFDSGIDFRKVCNPQRVGVQFPMRIN